MHGVGRDDVDARDLEVGQQLDLALAVTSAGRDGQATELLGPAVDAEAPGEKAVARHVLEHIVLAQAHHVHAPGHERRPPFEVVFGMVDDGRRAGGAGGDVHAHHVRQRHGEQLVRVARAQVLLGGKRQTAHIVHGAHGIGADVVLAKQGTVKRRLGRLGQALAQPFQLQSFYFRPGQLFRFVVIHGRSFAGTRRWSRCLYPQAWGCIKPQAPANAGIPPGNSNRASRTEKIADSRRRAVSLTRRPRIPREAECRTDSRRRSIP